MRPRKMSPGTTRKGLSLERHKHSPYPNPEHTLDSCFSLTGYTEVPAACHLGDWSSYRTLLRVSRRGPGCPEQEGLLLT